MKPVFTLEQEKMLYDLLANTKKSYTHIARNMGCSEETVKKRAKRWGLRFYQQNGQKMKAFLIIDIADDITESYKNFTVDYDLRGEDEDGNIVSIRYVEDAKLEVWG